MAHVDMSGKADEVVKEELEETKKALATWKKVVKDLTDPELKHDARKQFINIRAELKRLYVECQTRGLL